jgi:predicted outer membrane repeat protein
MLHVHLFYGRFSYNTATTAGGQISSSESITTQQRTRDRYDRKVISKSKCGLPQK